MVYTRGFNGKKMGKQVSLLHYHNDTGTGEEITWMNLSLIHISADQRNGVHLHRTS